MKRLWLFPLLLFIILLIAFQFRWNTGPLQKEGEFWVMQKVDRWTGYAWFYRAHIEPSLGADFRTQRSQSVQSEENEESEESLTRAGADEKEDTNADSTIISLASNQATEAEPLFLDCFIPAVNEGLLERRVLRAFEEEETKQRVLEIQYQIEDAARIREENLEGHREYVEVEERLRLRRSRRGPTTEQLAAHNAWFDADQTITNLNQELSNLSKEFREEAAQNIRNQVIFRTKLFTLGWLILTLVSLAAAIHYFVVEIKQIKRINETFEVIEYHTRKDRGRGEGAMINATV